MTSALTGKRIVITRPPHKAEAMADRLRALGADPVLLPMIAIRPAADTAPLDRALGQLDRYDWVIVTSANAVTHLWQRFDALNIDPAALDWPAVAVIGPATGGALRQRGVTPALVPETHVAEALFDAFRQRVDLPGTRVLLPQGNLARPVLADLLREAGADVETVIAYETVQPDSDLTRLAAPVDAITFTSSSTVQHFADAVADAGDDPLAVIGDALVVCIGPVTATAARDLGLPVHVVAEPHTLDGLLDALNTMFERNLTR